MAPKKQRIRPVIDALAGEHVDAKIALQKSVIAQSRADVAATEANLTSLLSGSGVVGGDLGSVPAGPL